MPSHNWRKGPYGLALFEAKKGASKKSRFKAGFFENKKGRFFINN